MEKKDNDVKFEMEKLKDATREDLKKYNERLTVKRLNWYKRNKNKLDLISYDLLESGYMLLLRKFNIKESDAPVIMKTDKKIVFHSKNFCPTLEACRLLNLDTKYICKYYNEKATDLLIKQIDKRLCFGRNYKKLRPYSDFCEEYILIKT